MRKHPCAVLQQDVSDPVFNSCASLVSPQALLVKRALVTSQSMSSLERVQYGNTESLPTVQMQNSSQKIDARLQEFMAKVGDSAFVAGAAYFPPMSPPKTSPPLSTPPLQSAQNTSSPRMYKSIAQVGVPEIPLSRGMLRVPHPPAHRPLVGLGLTRSAF